MKGIVISLLVIVLAVGVGIYYFNSSSNITGGSVLDNTNEVTFDLTSSHFKFYLNGVESPELKVKQGDKVTIILDNEEGFHDWVLDEFNAKTLQVWGGNSTSVEFIADKKGTFEYYCSVGQHRAMGMKGNFIVE